MALTCAVSCPSPVSESFPPTASARFAPEVCVFFFLVRQDCLPLLGPRPLSIVCSETLFTPSVACSLFSLLCLFIDRIRFFSIYSFIWLCGS